MAKKIISTLIIILIIVAVGFAAYWFFYKQENGEGNPMAGLNIGNFFPFGKGEEPTIPTSDNETPIQNNEIPQTEKPAPELWQISAGPQSGAVIFQNKDGEFVHYIDKATGNVFESKLTVVGQKRISNTTIPKVNEALWMPKGDSVILRYTTGDTETIQGLYAKIVASTKTSTGTPDGTENLSELQGILLPLDTSIFSILRGGEKIFYGIPSGNGIVAFTANPDGTKVKQVFSSPVREWLSDWPNENTVVLTTKPASDVLGYIYSLNLKSGTLNKIVGGKNGLTGLMKSDGTVLLYGENVEGNMVLNVMTLKTGAVLNINPKTLPEKCVWGNEKSPTVYCAVPQEYVVGKYPEIWYQGLVSFTDSIWKIDVSTGAAELIADPKTVAGAELDATNLMLDQNQHYLIFTNKKDYTLWGLHLAENDAS